MAYTWQVLEVCDSERNLLGNELIDALTPGPEMQAAVGAELSLLGDRQRILPALLEREQCLRDEDPKSETRLAALEQWLAVHVKEYEETHGTRFRHRGRLVIEDLLAAAR